MEELNNTVIEVDDKLKNGGRRKGTPNRNRSSTVASRHSSTSKSESENENEGNSRITAWLKKTNLEEEKKKRKAENPEHGGKESKKKDEAQVEGIMNESGQETLAMLRMFQEIKDKLDSRDEEDKKR